VESLPHLLDNEAAAGGRHDEALEYLIGEYDLKHALAVATGYVNLGGLQHLAAIADGRPTRLMIGAQPAPGLGADHGPLPVFERHLALLSGERDRSRFPPSRAARALAAVEAWLDRPEVSVRRYTERFLHGKAYLLGSASDGRVALITSANLTRAGLSANLELGVASYGPPVSGAAVAWFDRLWEAATPYEDDLRALLFPDPGLVDPATVYLRALLELQEPDLDDPDRPSRPTAVAMAPFQVDGYERARAIVQRHGGVVYADGVGTGKTEIGLAFIEERTAEDGVYALVIAPAQLARRWRERIDQAKLPAQVVSFQELASDEQLAPGPAPRRRLHNRKDAYRLVIIDEAHALRNEDTSWYRAMERLMGGSPKELVLLTATPINNGLWDLYNLVMLFARHDRAFAGAGIDSIRDLFMAAGANRRDPDDLSPDALFPLADAVSVRRDRGFIEREYKGERFPNGLPVRFPTPRLTTVRYDLDAAHPGLFDTIVDSIDALSMARYRPSAYELGAQESAVEAQLGGLLKSGILKRFESCWRACLETVELMIGAHDAFAAAWAQGRVLAGEALRQAAAGATDEAGLAALVEEALAGVAESRPASDFDSAYGEAVATDRERLVAVRNALAELRPEDDPKLAGLVEVLEAMDDEKVAVFSTFAATVRYLDDRLPERVGGRDRVVVIGGESGPEERMRALQRFAPRTVVGPDYEPADGQVGMLISTDVLSEGQNLQQAQAVVSYDMPWNPQRVVQRNGRVIRLMSEHDEVHLVTMLPEPGELERLLGLEARVRMKIKAASGVYGMESEVIEGIERGELRSFAERLIEGDATLLDEAEQESGAFVGEELRRVIARAAAEGEIDRVSALPWGIGACLRQSAERGARQRPGVFFACRTPPMREAPEGYRYWRYVELFHDGDLVGEDLEMLRRIDPAELAEAEAGDLDLERAWKIAAAEIVAAHNERTDLRSQEERIGPRQRWALDLLRDPAVALPGGADLADEALSVERSSAVRRALGEVEAALVAGEIGRDEAAFRIVGVVTAFGLGPVPPPPLPQRIDVDDLGVVCWMGVLPPAAP
jgi:superfamily II DNA or RNA helicase